MNIYIYLKYLNIYILYKYDYLLNNDLLYLLYVIKNIIDIN